MITTNEIIEGNKLIAAFMGYIYFPHNMEGVTIPGWKTTIDTSNVSKFNNSHNLFLGGVNFKHENGTTTVLANKRDEPKRHYLCRNHNDLRYFESMDWLILVLYKIESLKYNINILRTTCCIYDEDFRGRNDGQYLSITGETKHEAIWLAVIKFIKEENKRSKNNV